MVVLITGLLKKTNTELHTYLSPYVRLYMLTDTDEKLDSPFNYNQFIITHPLLYHTLGSPQ